VSSSQTDVILWFPGVAWDGVAGTDRHLVSHLAKKHNIVWVNPIRSVLRNVRFFPVINKVQPGVVIVSISGPPGVNKPVIRVIARFVITLAVSSILKRLNFNPSAVVVSRAGMQVPDRPKGIPRIYYETDDFVAGASLFRQSSAYLERVRRYNVNHSSAVLAVSHVCLETIGPAPGHIEVMPNGCCPELFAASGLVAVAPEVDMSGPVAGLIGQLNERIDFDLLMAVAEAGMNLLVVGPDRTTSLHGASALKTLAAHPRVKWVGRQPFERLPEFLSAITVGLTPYVNTPFNRASDPLKTLEYLSAGIPVVSTNIPASAAIDSRFVEVKERAEDFVAAVLRYRSLPSEETKMGCRAVAVVNSWERRASRFSSLLDQLEKKQRG
jgi:teichuronic acid biosynthesis glycosyltransferase TuaH